TFTGSNTLNNVSVTSGTFAFNTTGTGVIAGTTTLGPGAGNVRFDGGNWTLGNVTFATNGGGADNSHFVVTAGNVNLQNYSGGRSGGTTTPDTTTGFQISGGVITANQVRLATNNSWSTLNMSG